MKKFTKFARKHLYQSLFPIKLQAINLQLYQTWAPTQQFSCKFWQIFQDSCLRFFPSFNKINTCSCNEVFWKMAAYKFRKNLKHNCLKELILIGLQVRGRMASEFTKSRLRNNLFTSNYPCHLILRHLAKIFILDRRLIRTDFTTNKRFPSDATPRNVIENMFFSL